MISTGIKFFGQKIFIEATGEKEVDKALKSAFEAGYWLASLPEMRPDVKLLLERNKG